MKGDFIIKFLEGIRITALDIGKAWGQIPYKGVRYSNFNISGYNPRKKYIGFKNLERRGLIKVKINDYFVFTKRGQNWLQHSFIRYFYMKNGGVWDRKWRIIIFDIPQELHRERIKFRRKLKSMGFFMLQKSVFVFPYPCNEEITDLSNILGVTDYVDIIIAESPGLKEQELLKIFNL